VAAAWIGFASGLIAAGISVFLAVRQTRMDEGLVQLQSSVDAELERVKAELAPELHRRQAMIDRELNAEDVLTR